MIAKADEDRAAIQKNIEKAKSDEQAAQTETGQAQRVRSTR